MFIVLEGIDGAGKGKQREEILHKLSQTYKYDVKGEEFPVHNAFYETIIHPALQEETALNSASWVLSFLLDKTLQSDKIINYAKNKENLFIADGYFTTMIAYQSFLSKQVNLKKLLDYAKDFDIPKPDLTIFIDVEPEIAMQRKEKEEGHDEGLDINERDISKQIKLRKIFKKMIKQKIYCKWELVDGNKTINEVRDSIINVLKRRKMLP